ncbi:MAG TPA: hypothetical protein VIL37_00295 [Natronosporangium sp.]
MRRLPLGSAMLAIGFVAALALGGYWWVSNAPPATPGLGPSPGLLPPTTVVTATPATFPPAEPVEIDLDHVEQLLPPRVEVIRGDVILLADGETIDYSSTVPGDSQYLLEVACLGPGIVRITVVTPDRSQHGYQVECDGGGFRSVEFAITNHGYVSIVVLAITDQAVGVATQLVVR